MVTFAQIIVNAQARTGMSRAEFDHDLAHGQGSIAALANTDALIDATRPERDAAVAAAKRKSYTGWSTASRGPIRYAR